MRLRHVLALLAFPIAASAQKAPTVQLSLEEALTVAARQQPDLRNAEADLRYAIAGTRAAKAAYLPQLTVETDMRYNAIIPTSILPGNALNPSGDPNKLTPVKFNTTWNNSAGLRLIQPIYDPSKLVAINNGRTASDLAMARQNRIRQDQEESIARAWFDLLLQRAKLDYAGKDFERADGNATLIGDRLKEGRALDNDLADARLRVRTAALEKERIQQDILTAQVNLSSLMGYDTLVLVDPKERLMDVPALRDSSWMREDDAPDAADTRPELAEQKVNLQVSNLQLDSKRADRLPKLNLEGYLGANHFNSTFNPFVNWYGNSFLGLSLRWPLFRGGAAKFEIEQAVIQTEQQGNAIRKLRQQYYYDLVNSRRALTYQWKLVRLQRERLAIREERIGLVKSRLEEGRATPQDLLEEETLLLREEDQLYQQLHDFLTSRLAYNKARGRQTLR
jgi:outer membrane protein TolC